jgi:NADPH:quinone reductase-like Zn-dependent oxidoreductase
MRHTRIIVTHYGGPDALQVVEETCPEPKDGEVRVRLFRQDLIALLDLLQQQKIKPLIARRFLLADARHAQELLGQGGVTGKIVLVSNSSFVSGAEEQCHPN